MNLLSEEKKESEVEVKPTENSVSEKPSVEDAKKTEDAKIEAESKSCSRRSS